MQELNQFCHKYLPEYFALKYSQHKLKDHFFNFNNEGNVYELTGRNFALLDKLFAANRDLEGSKLIQSYFIFTIMEFKKYRGEVNEGAQDKDRKCRARQTVRQILKTMNQKDRMCFQIFMRIAFFYFQTKEIEHRAKKSKLFKKVESNKEDYEDQIIAFFNDMKFLSMTDDDSFNPSAFMEYCIRILLELSPNAQFFKFVNKIMNQCQLGQSYQDRVKSKIDAIKEKQMMESLKNQIKKTPLKKQSSNSQSSILEPKNQNIPQAANSKIQEQTPLKAKSGSKSERKTHETSQKKEYIDNKKEQEPNTLNALKKSLQMQKNRSIKQRTIYSRKTYLMPKKMTILDQTSSTGSNHNNNNQELFLLDFNRSYSSRYLEWNNDDNDDEDDDFLVGATPKPKKKVKIDKSYTGTFDEEGNFVRGLNERGI